MVTNSTSLNRGSRNFTDQTLPGWCYDNAEFHALEREKLMLGTWIFVGHKTEFAAAGDYRSIEAYGERALVIRDTDGALHAFYNTCRHRAHALVTGESGNCAGALRCPYHGWTYSFDGRLRAVPAEATFPAIDKSDFGLKEIELEIFLGFVFVRFRSGAPSVADRYAAYLPEMSAYRSEEMVPLSRGWKIDIDIDWKNLMDNYLEGYHVPVGHPGLYRLFGSNYSAEVRSDVSRQLGVMHDRPSPVWSERMYQRLLPTQPHLTSERQRAWSYYALLPNFSFDFYPDLVCTFEALPLGPGKVRLQARRYTLPGGDRRLKAAQWLNARINSDVQREDEDLVQSVQKGLTSRSYTYGLLSQKEVALRRMHDIVRTAVPVAILDEPPAPGTMRAVNEAMARGDSAAA